MHQFALLVIVSRLHYRHTAGRLIILRKIKSDRSKMELSRWRRTSVFEWYTRVVKRNNTGPRQVSATSMARRVNSYASWHPRARSLAALKPPRSGDCPARSGSAPFRDRQPIQSLRFADSPSPQAGRNCTEAKASSPLTALPETGRGRPTSMPSISPSGTKAIRSSFGILDPGHDRIFSIIHDQHKKISRQNYGNTVR